MAKLTQKKAKEITLEVWRYLRDHPEISEKNDLPKKIYYKIEYFIADCALCKLFIIPSCIGCPLRSIPEESHLCSDFWSWENSIRNKERTRYAGRIVELVEKWEPEE